MALDNLACDVGDKNCKPSFNPGMGVKESSHTSGAASELLGGFTLFALELCCDIADVFVVGFLSKPEGTSAFIEFIPRNDRELTFERYGPRDDLYSGTCRSLSFLRFRRLLVRA